jgi:D-cysteine desulfhydrase
MLPASIPRADLGVVPSPLEEHSDLASRFGLESLLVKRDDLNGIDFGGNKRRALEFLLAGESFCPVSMGGFGSTWCAALATVAARLDRHAHLALFPQPWTPAVSGLLSTTLTHARVEIASSRWAMPGALWRSLRGAVASGRARWIPAGGASPIGVLGSVNGALELVSQVEAGGLSRPEAVIVPLGSGGTAAGLVLGFHLAGWNVRVLGVRVADAWVANRWQVGRLMATTERVLRRYGVRIPGGAKSLTVVGDQYGRGYGHATEAARAAQAVFAAAGVALDLTYSAKAAASLQEAANRFRRICFWHTFDTRLMSDPLSRHPLFQRAQACAESLWRHSKST